MKRLLVLILFISILAIPDGLAKKSRTEKSDSQAATSASQPGGSNASAAATGSDATTATTSGDSGDVGKTLDDLLSKPVNATSPSNEPVNIELPPTNNEPAPVSPQPAPAYKPLSPKAAPTVLRGDVTMNGVHMQSNAANDVLQAQANQDDPDVRDQELMIAWDRWRNNLLRYIQMQVQANVNSPEMMRGRRRRFDPMTGMMIVQPPFPLGIVAWFDCEVGNDRHINRIQITQSSGFPEYDRMVVDGIRALDGLSILQFPRGSRRISVRQEAGIETATSGGVPMFNFGDVERFIERSMPGAMPGGRY